MNSTSYAYVKNLHNGEKSFLPVKKLFVIKGKCLQSFKPTNENDFNPEEEYGVKIGENIVLHFISTMAESLSKLKKRVQQQGVSFKTRTSNSRLAIPVSNFAKEQEIMSVQTKQKQTKATAQKASQDQLNGILKRQSQHILSQNSSEGRVFPQKRSAPTELKEDDCQCDHTLCPVIKKLKRELKSAEEKVSQMEQHNMGLMEMIESLKLKIDAQDSISPEILLHKLNVLQDVVENIPGDSRSSEILLHKLNVLQDIMEKIPTGVLALLQENAHLLGSAEQVKASSRFLEDEHVIVPDGQKYIGRGVFITVDQWEDAEMKLNLSARVTKIADAILPSGLVAYNIKGPTPENPRLQPLKEEQILTVVGALNRMTWLTKPVINARIVSAALSKAAYEKRRPAEKRNVTAKKSMRSSQRKGRKIDDDCDDEKTSDEEESSVQDNEDVPLRKDDENDEEEGKENMEDDKTEEVEKDENSQDNTQDIYENYLKNKSSVINTCADMFSDLY